MARSCNGVRCSHGSTGWRIPRTMVFLLLLALVPMDAYSASPEQTPTEAVRRAMNEVLYILTELKDASRSAQRQWEIEQVVRRTFNYQEMAERSLGETWSSLQVADRRQYVRLFVQLLRDEVADRLREYSAAQVTYLSEQGDEGTMLVTTAPAGPEVDTRIEFQVVQRSGLWLMNDLVIDGASIVANYQTQFSRILREGSFSELMERMRQKAPIAALFHDAVS